MLHSMQNPVVCNCIDSRPYHASSSDVMTEFLDQTKCNLDYLIDDKIYLWVNPFNIATSLPSEYPVNFKSFFQSFISILILRMHRSQERYFVMYIMMFVLTLQRLSYMGSFQFWNPLFGLAIWKCLLKNQTECVISWM